MIPPVTDPDASNEVSIKDLGEAHAAGCRMLEARYHLPADCALLLTSVVIATAVGPTTWINDILGDNLPLSLDLTLCTAPDGIAAAAVTGAFQILRRGVHGKLRWKGAAGTRQLQADFIEVLDAMEKADREWLKMLADQGTEQSIPSDYESINRTRGRQELGQKRVSLREVLVARRMDMLPHLVGEDVPWASLLEVDKLAFDSCFTNLRLSGSGLREALSARPRDLHRVTRLLQASRRGGNMTTGASILLNPVLIDVEIVSRDLLARAYHDRGVREAGLLDGMIIELPAGPSRLAAAPFMEDRDEKSWDELITGLFARRVRCQAKIYRVDVAGFDACEDFREWCHLTDFQLTATWPTMLLKLALAIHIGAGKAEDTLDATTVVAAAEVLKRVGTNQIRLFESLDDESPEDTAIQRMVGKLQLLGTATQRELFRHYSGQKYDVLTPVLNRAIAAGVIIRDGNLLSLPDVNVSASMIS